MAFYKMLVGKYRFQKDMISLQSWGSGINFLYILKVEKAFVQRVNQGRGNQNIHYQNISNASVQSQLTNNGNTPYLNVKTIANLLETLHPKHPRA